jgi:hypothetical protein
MGEINKGAVAGLILLLFAAGGYMWWQMLYKPAVADLAVARTTESQAQTALEQANQQLLKAQQQIEESKNAAKETDDSVSRVQLARKAVPNERLIDDAAIVLMDLASRSGIRTSFKAGGNGDAASFAADGGALNGAIPIDLEFKAVGRYDEMMLFMGLVEGTVERRGDTLYMRDRLFNVVKLKIGSDDASPGSGGAFSPLSGGAGGGPRDADDEMKAGPGEISFTVTVRMYSSSTENAQGVGASTPDDPAASGTDPNAQGIDPATGQPTDPTAGGADANATLTAPASDPANAGAPAGGGFS